jgi:uncharacterized membrane protein
MSSPSVSPASSPRINRPVFVVLVLLCLLISVYASSYYLALISGDTSGLLSNKFGPQLLAVHAGFGSVALLLGPFQFLPGLRGKRPRVHHFIGRLYMVGVFTSGSAGLVLALGSEAGPIATLGFGSMAIVWLYVTFQGLRTAMARKIDEHRRWMFRSFAVTLAALSLRLQLPLMFMSANPEQAYLIISFTCWIPNLILVEMWLRMRKKKVVVAT